MQGFDMIAGSSDFVLLILYELFEGQCVGRLKTSRFMPAFTRAIICRFHSIAPICAWLSVPRLCPIAMSERENKGQEIKLETHQRDELLGRPCVRPHYYPRHPRPLYPATRGLPRSCLSQCLARHVRWRCLLWGINTLLLSHVNKKRKEKETLGE